MNLKALRIAILGALMGTVGVANAAVLSIVDVLGGDPTHPEAIGDPGGTSYPGTNAGLPTILGGWPSDPNMAADPSFGGNVGIQGWHAAFLVLDQAANVTFQFLGDGNAALNNTFQVFTGGSWVTLFTGSSTGCNVSGATPSYSCGAGSQASFDLGAGFVPFRYITGSVEPVTLTNGVNNPDPQGNEPAFFLGADPYLVGGTGNEFNNLSAVFAGLTDLPAPGDHDFQDLGVRISVPEPGTIALFGVGLLAVALTFGFRRRTPGSMEVAAA
jgi:hypothetical protein